MVLLSTALVLAPLLFLRSPNSAGAVERAGRTYPELTAKKIRASASGESPRVSSLPPAAPESWKSTSKMGRAEQQAREIPNKLPFRKQVEGVETDPLPVAATFNGVQMPAPLVSFDGISSNDNFSAYGFRIVPPDTIGDVGPHHYVQAVNSLFRVFDKSGNPLTPPLKMSSLFAPLGTGCSLRDDGDPIVLYDQLADRWLLSQLCKNLPPFRQMIAVSTSGDPTGSYHVFEFVMPNVKQNDYPKLAIWPDAVYMTTDEFYGADYAGSGVFAFDRAKLLSGDPDASYIYFDLASPSTIRLGGLLPVDLDGLEAPPSGAPGMFLGYTATEYGDAEDGIRVFEFSVDFDDPGLSSFSEASGSPLIAPAFDPTSEPGRDDIPQPAPGEKLDAQSDRLMYRAAYRNNGGTESIVVNQTVRASGPGEPYVGGVRLHQLIRTYPGMFSLDRSLTISSPGTSRFMGASAVDHEGNVAVAYSTSSAGKPPSVFYTGIAAANPGAGFMVENDLIRGDGVQTAVGFRWGDYSGLGADVDGCTFWATNQYYSKESQAESGFGWKTRIGSFRFDGCTDQETGFLSGAVTDADTGDPIEDAVVSLTGGFSRTTSSGGAYSPILVLPGTYEVKVSARGYRESMAIVEVTAVGTLRDFSLDPIPLIERSDISFVEESCTVNQAAEPGERVSLDLPLVNVGAGNTARLVVGLMPSGSVTEPSRPVSYGPMPPGGPAVTRRFSFTVSEGLPCGSLLELMFRLSEGKEQLGIIRVFVNAGSPRVAFFEDFDSSPPGSLPAGWTTSSEGGQSGWEVSDTRSFSAEHSVYSPSPRLVGLNELVTPTIQLATDNPLLTFRNWYDLETTFLRNRLFDGSVLEISVDGGEWQDITDAGAEFLSGGYDLGTIDSCCGNPLAGRRGWSGRSGTEDEPDFVISRIGLPAGLSGHAVRFRWRVGTDTGTSREGQYLDDVLVLDGFECGC